MSSLPKLSSPSHLTVIINPASGKPYPILRTLNDVLTPAGIEWEVRLTHRPGDARALAQAAVQNGAQALAVYGGDGTVMEAASGLAALGSRLPLLILPGGTANVMSVELGLPTDPVLACQLLAQPETSALRAVDMIRYRDQFFWLRLGTGLEAQMVAGADRSLKDVLGVLAYGVSFMQALNTPLTARYRLTLDGEALESEGVACLIANSAHFGASGLSLAPHVDVSDGWLDVFVIRNSDLSSLWALATSMMTGESDYATLLRWTARTITLEADPPLTVQGDGELIGPTPLTVQIAPGAVNVIVPAPAN